MNNKMEQNLSPERTSSISLRRGRVHEVYGSGKYGFAAYMCQFSGGPIIWMGERGQGAFINPDGLAEFCDPGKFIFTFGSTHMDVLWMAEEALRSGVAPIVVVKIEKSLGLTAGRRLQLAAEAGGGLGLFLIKEGQGSHATETRWHCLQVCESQALFQKQADPQKNDREDSTLFDWRCTKNKSGTLTRWVARWHGATHHMYLVEQISESEMVAARAL